VLRHTKNNLLQKWLIQFFLKIEQVFGYVFCQFLSFGGLLGTTASQKESKHENKHNAVVGFYMIHSDGLMLFGSVFVILNLEPTLKPNNLVSVLIH